MWVHVGHQLWVQVGAGGCTWVTDPELDPYSTAGCGTGVGKVYDSRVSSSCVVLYVVLYV